MGVGDAAVAAGMAIVNPATGDVRDGATEINQTRDYLANHQVSGTHDAGAIASGILPIARGGTGGGTASAARTALGVKLAQYTVAGDTVPLRSAGGHIEVIDGTITSHAASWGQLNDAKAGNLLPAVYSNAIAGTRNALWVENTGRIGFASSSKYKKQDFAEPEITIEQLRAIHWTLYRMRSEVAREKREPGHRAATEIGFFAEDLHRAGLWPFVIYLEGKPAGIHYELLSIAAIQLAQRAWDAIDELTARLDKLEGGL